MPTIIIQSDWPGQPSDAMTLIERVIPGQTRDRRYVLQLVERIIWALDDAEQRDASEAEPDAANPDPAWTRPAPPASDRSRTLVST
jgi:hypothetical protein